MATEYLEDTEWCHDDGHLERCDQPMFPFGTEDEIQRWQTIADVGQELFQKGVDIDKSVRIMNEIGLFKF